MKYPGPDLNLLRDKATLVFGQHFGKHISQVPIDYLRWMIKHHSWQWGTAKDELERRIKEQQT